MNSLITNKLIQFILAGIIAAIVGAIIGTWISPSANDTSGDSNTLNSLSTPREKVVFKGGDAPKTRSAEPGGRSAGVETTLELPLTTTSANTAGWNESGQCVAGLGRYFTKGEGEPFALMYNKTDILIGVYHFSLTELPSPFVERPVVLEAGISTNHWGLFIYFIDPTNAC